MTTVGIVGLGLLGSAVASRLIKAGHAVVGFDVLPERVQALTVLGGKPAPSAAVGTPLPFTDRAERLYAAAQAAGHGAEDLAVVVTALEKHAAGRRKAPRSATTARRRAKSSPKSRGRRRPGHSGWVSVTTGAPEGPSSR